MLSMTNISKYDIVVVLEVPTISSSGHSATSHDPEYPHFQGLHFQSKLELYEVFLTDQPIVL